MYTADHSSTDYSSTDHSITLQPSLSYQDQKDKEIKGEGLEQRTENSNTNSLYTSMKQSISYPYGRFDCHIIISVLNTLAIIYSLYLDVVLMFLAGAIGMN